VDTTRAADRAHLTSKSLDFRPNLFTLFLLFEASKFRLKSNEFDVKKLSVADNLDYGNLVCVILDCNGDFDDGKVDKYEKLIKSFFNVFYVVNI